MNAIEFVTFIGLIFVEDNDENNLYLIDDFCLGCENDNYGILGEFTKEDLIKGNIDIKTIPTNLIESFFNVFKEGLYDYELDELAKTLTNVDFKDWYDILKKHNYDFDEVGSYSETFFNDLCEILKGKKGIEPMTNDEYETLYKNQLFMSGLLDIDFDEIKKSIEGYKTERTSVI